MERSVTDGEPSWALFLTGSKECLTPASAQGLEKHWPFILQKCLVNPGLLGGSRLQDFKRKRPARVSSLVTWPPVFLSQPRSFKNPHLSHCSSSISTPLLKALHCLPGTYRGSVSPQLSAWTSVNLQFPAGIMLFHASQPLHLLLTPGKPFPCTHSDIGSSFKKITARLSHSPAGCSVLSLTSPLTI